MKNILAYVKKYFVSVNKYVLALCILFIALFIFVNFHYKLNHFIGTLPDSQEYASWYLVFLIAFTIPYGLQSLFNGPGIFSNYRFVLLLLIAPAIFAWKMVFEVHVHLSNDVYQNTYWNQVIYWPFKLIVITAILYVIWRIFDRDKVFYGVSLTNFKPMPYLIMLLIMLPLIAAASTQHDFLAMYPKMKNVYFLHNEHKSGLYKLLYELSYGSDFFSIELFFRGFLVLAFAKWVGKDAILPMACFYCTIHFGKPLGECISSFFGGMILGIVTYNTRTIFGGLMVHLGIAWMMELGGYLGNSYM